MVLLAARGAAADPASAHDDDASAHDDDASARYRGRATDDAVAEGLLWLPRRVLMPVYVLTEFGLRRPIVAVAAFADRHDIGPWVEHVMNPTPDFRWGPTFNIDFSARSLFGAAATLRNAGLPGNELSAGLAGGGESTWEASAQDRMVSRGAAFGARFYLLMRPDRSFFGLGPRSGTQRVYYAISRVDAELFAGMDLGHHAKATVSEGFRFQSVRAGDPPSIDTAFPFAALPVTRPTDLARASLDLTLDSRATREQSGGARLVMQGAYARDLAAPGAVSFVSTSVDAQAAAEVMRPDRVLVGRVMFRDSAPLAGGSVPFAELSTLGGEDHVGFVPGRFRAEAATMAELSYRYPFAYYLDVKWTASAGNVFARDLSDFALERLTASLGMSARVRRVPVFPLELGFGVGSSRFEEPAFRLTSAHVWLTSREML
jgi:hypothetical protein